MENSRQNKVRTKEINRKERSAQLRKDPWKNSLAEELRYRVISDENSIYEYDMNCIQKKEKMKS